MISEHRDNKGGDQWLPLLYVIDAITVSGITRFYDGLFVL